MPAVVLSGANADVVLAALVALTCSGCDSANVPLTSLPVAAALGSETDSVALPAVLMTDADSGGVVRAGDGRHERAEAARLAQRQAEHGVDVAADATRRAAGALAVEQDGLRRVVGVRDDDQTGHRLGVGARRLEADVDEAGRVRRDGAGGAAGGVEDLEVGGTLALADLAAATPAVLLLASAMSVIVSGASPVFLIVIGTHVRGGRGTGGDGRERGRQAEDGRDDVRAATLEVAEAGDHVGQRRAVLLLAVVLDLALAGGEDRPVVDLTRAEGARRAAAACWSGSG